MLEVEDSDILEVSPAVQGVDLHGSNLLQRALNMSNPPLHPLHTPITMGAIMRVVRGH